MIEFKPAVTGVSVLLALINEPDSVYMATLTFPAEPDVIRLILVMVVVLLAANLHRATEYCPQLASVSPTVQPIGSAPQVLPPLLHVNWKSWVAGTPRESVTCTVKLYGPPADVAVPVNTPPVLRLKATGSVPRDNKDQVRPMPLPPVAAKVCE